MYRGIYLWTHIYFFLLSFSSLFITCAIRDLAHLDVVAFGIAAFAFGSRLMLLSDVDGYALERLCTRKSLAIALESRRCCTWVSIVAACGGWLLLSEKDRQLLHRGVFCT